MAEKLKFFCVVCSRKKGKKVTFETDNYDVVTKTFHRKKKIEGQRKKVKIQLLDTYIAI